MGRPLAGADVVVAGAGGAAHAVVFACLAARSAAGHDREPDARVGRGAGRRGSVRRRIRVACPRWRSTARSSIDALGSADLAVNATTVGMVDPGIDVRRRAPARTTATVFDCVYVPAETPLVAAARARGLRAANGSEMLIAQAAIAFERWTGVGGMADVMRAAVAPLLADATVTA